MSASGTPCQPRYVSRSGREDGGVRLFVALAPPVEAVEELRSATAGLAALAVSAAGLRWTRPEQWHVTLVFLGEVGDDTVSELTRRLRRAAARHSPLSLAFGGAGRFGHRVLWTGVHGDRSELRRLADSAGAAARRTRLQVASRPYRPHLTLARAAPGADLRPLVTRLASWQGSGWGAKTLHLVRSRLGAAPDGTALHETISDWPLGG